MLARLSCPPQVVRRFHICTFFDRLTGRNPPETARNLTKRRQHPRTSLPSSVPRPRP